ncbi:MAG: hypothetical protein ACYTXY_08550 [Nostoc sp.]
MPQATAEAQRSQCIAGVPRVVATGATRREVGAAASAVGAARRRHLNFGGNQSLEIFCVSPS